MATKLSHQNPLTMTKSFNTHSELLKELKTAVNRVAYSTTKSNHKEAIKAMHEMFKFLEQMEVIDDSKPSKKAAKAPAKASKKPRKKAVRSRRPNKNEVLEARMQRESSSRREAKLQKQFDASRKVVDAATGGEPHVGRERKEVFVAPTEHKGAKKAALKGLQGLSPEDAARRDALLAERAALEEMLLAEGAPMMDDCSPF